MRAVIPDSPFASDLSDNVLPSLAKRVAHPLCLVWLLCLGLISGAKTARADGTLTLQLPPSQKALEQRAAQEREAAARADAARFAAVKAASTPTQYHRSAPNRGGLPWRGQQREERTIGRLGQLMRSASIYRAPSAEARRLVVAPAGTYVAVQVERERWCGVLMADGSTGWLPTQDVDVLNYAVLEQGRTGLPGMSGRMPSGSDEGDIYPHGSTPFFTGDAQALLAEAYKYLGVPYVWGGNTVSGLDCSGFVKRVFGAFGYPLPRLGSDQMASGVPVSVDQLQAGDRLYFGRRTDRLGVQHTGIYIGNGLFIHASSAHHHVTISSLSEPLYSRIYVCARR